jgi:PTH1 family peptidyl-tRNA hydrolase
MVLFMEKKQIKLIVGLGNPDKEYEHTRHNAGFWLLSQLADGLGISFHVEKKFFGKLAKTRYENRDLWLLMPQTFVNASGRSVAALSQFYKIEPAEILSVHDELDLPVGTNRLKFGGHHGGHNGLKSIDAQLGSKDYWRLRIGIDHPGHKSLVTPYVLKQPSLEDFRRIIDSFSVTFDQMRHILSGDFSVAMQEINQKNQSGN